jgi:hypothetical protein
MKKLKKSHSAALACLGSSSVIQPNNQTNNGATTP